MTKPEYDRYLKWTFDWYTALKTWRGTSTQVDLGNGLSFYQSGRHYSIINAGNASENSRDFRVVAAVVKHEVPYGLGLALAVILPLALAPETFAQSHSLDFIGGNLEMSSDLNRASAPAPSLLSRVRPMGAPCPPTVHSFNEVPLFRRNRLVSCFYFLKSHFQDAIIVHLIAFLLIKSNQIA